VSVALTAADVASGGSLAVTAVNPPPGGGTSAATTLPVVNLAPAAIVVVPNAFVTGDATMSVDVQGTNFVAGSIARVNGSPRATTVTYSNMLTFQLTAADQASPGQLTVDVFNPAPGGGTSAPVTITITSATPTLTNISPAQLIVGSGDSQIQIYGAGLAWGETVQWNGADLNTGFTYSDRFLSFLVATVPANLLASPGTATVTVRNPAATPKLSNSLVVHIVEPPVPTLASFSTAAIPTGAAATLTLNGAGFTPTSTVAFRGLTLPITFGASSQSSVAIPASALLLPGVDPLTITNVTGTSAPIFVTTYVPILNNSMVYNSANGLFYLSVPSAAGAPYANSVVSIDPATGALGKPIFVGSEPNRMAITADGRYLWVALDGAASIRKVDLSTGTAGYQFSVASNGLDALTVSAVADLPGAADSVVVSTYNGLFSPASGVSLTIYDSGVPRNTAISSATYSYDPIAWALLVDPARNEIYGLGGMGANYYKTYSYSASGITLKSSTLTSLSYALNNTDEAQIVAGRMFTDYGQVVDPESGALLGTLYSSGTIAPQGSMTVDTTLGRIFVLEAIDQGIASSSFQLGAFNLADLTRTAAAPIPITLADFRAGYQYAGPTSNRLTRWGSNGLALRGTDGFVSLRTSLVRDLSTVDADLGVSIRAAGTPTTGNTTIYTATVMNHGPAAASDATLTGSLPSTGVLVSVTPSTGACSGSPAVLCRLGNLASGSSASVVIQVLQTSAGSGSLAIDVNASETDPVLANNHAVSALNITGSAQNLMPAVAAISPTAIVSGSSDTVITVSGSGFSSSSTVLLNGAPQPTTFTSVTQLSTTVPAADLASLGWASISVSNPAPGGGTSSAVPLTVYSVLDLGADHILYDPYSRDIMASIGPGTSTVPANSLVAITPSTGAVGAAVPLGTTPTNVALTTDGQILYVLLQTSGAVARFNMLTHQPDFTAGNFPVVGYNAGLRDIAIQPGSDNIVAIDEGEYPGVGIFDFDAVAKTAIQRGGLTGTYTGTCLAFPDPNSLFASDLYSSPRGLDRYTVSASGLLNGSYPYRTTTVAQYMECYKLDGGLVFSNDGGVITSDARATQLGVFEGMTGLDSYGNPVRNVEPDTSLQRVFFMRNNITNTYSETVDSITAYDLNTFLPITVLPLGFSNSGGNTDPNAGTNAVDLIRWGQDGLAALTMSGQLYLLRGPAIVPELLHQNSAAILIASSGASLTHGAGNTLLTLVGSNFVPGVAVTWNSSYRTTKIIDATHVSVAIPANDLAQAGTATITVINPGAAASAPLTFSIN
jgi:uncharacterized repeat protein (TIGR01451 family)